MVMISTVGSIHLSKYVYGNSLSITFLPCIGFKKKCEKTFDAMTHHIEAKKINSEFRFRSVLSS